MGAEAVIAYSALASAGTAAYSASEQRSAAKERKSDIRKERAKAKAEAEAEARKTTAAAVDADSETARKKKRRSASLLTKDFAEPVLGSQGLTGA